jgi:glycosyltransferase involved in cell wall biosynthesis
MASPLVSVIIPCYRQARLLPGAIESALAQTHPAVQVVVVNDGSDDNTDEVADRYRTRVRYVRKPNGGLPSARNAGIAAAEGDWLHFLDADDLLHPRALAWLVEAVSRDSAQLGMMGFRCFQEDPARDGQPPVRASVPGLLPYLLEYNFGPPHAYLASREAVLKVGCFEESLTSCEDWDLWQRLALGGARFALTPEVGAYYRRYAGSMSTNSLRMLRMRTRILLRAHAALLERPELFDRWAADLLRIEERVYWRHLAQRRVTPELAELVARIQELHALNVGSRRPAGQGPYVFPAPWAACSPPDVVFRWVMKKVGTVRGLGLAFHLMRVCRPGLFRNWKEGIV